MPKWKWTAEQDAVLLAGIAEQKNLKDIAAVIGCRRHHAYDRARVLAPDHLVDHRKRTNLPRDPISFDQIDREEQRPDAPVRTYWTQDTVLAMDAAFCEAMTIAIEECRERATLGVKTAPCTERPIFIPAEPLHMLRSHEFV